MHILGSFFILLHLCVFYCVCMLQHIVELLFSFSKIYVFFILNHVLIVLCQAMNIFVTVFLISCLGCFEFGCSCFFFLVPFHGAKLWSSLDR